MTMVLKSLQQSDAIYSHAFNAPTFALCRLLHPFDVTQLLGIPLPHKLPTGKAVDLHSRITGEGIRHL